MKKLISIVLVLFTTVALGACVRDGLPEEELLDYDFSVYFGASLDPIAADELTTGFEQETGLKVRAITESDTKKAEKTLLRELRSTQPPAAYIVSKETELDGLEAGELFPFVVNGSGLVVDTALVSEWFGEDLSSRFIDDLSNCTGEQWLTFIRVADLYISGDISGTVTLGENKYTFPEKKGVLTSELNGVFAIPGGEPLSFVNMLTENAYFFAPDAVLSFQAVSEGIAELTSSLAGKYASGLRGTDFTNPLYYSVAETFEVFALGKAVFMPMSTYDYDAIFALNASKADNLTLIPIKLPALENQKIQIETSYSFALNQQNSQYEENAKAFIEYVQNCREQYLNSLCNAAAYQLNAGRAYEAKKNPDMLVDFEAELEKSKELPIYLATRNLDEEKIAAFTEYLQSLWPDADVTGETKDNGVIPA
jgi:raffinose/stachyose/melibiose transport system substrate-binding protein